MHEQCQADETDISNDKLAGRLARVEHEKQRLAPGAEAFPTP